MLAEWLMNTPAWKAASPTARSLYIEIKRRYNGSNNGTIRLSHREAASLLNVTKNTVGRYYKELIRLGFLAMERGAFLGPDGTGETCHWRLTEETCNGQPPTKDFTRWRPEPATPKQKARPKLQDTASQDQGRFPQPSSEIEANLPNLSQS
jgi:DNA-binding transcriptional MocR family regulator